MDLLKTEQEIKPTLIALENDQSSYDPHLDDQYLTQGTYLLKQLSDAKKQIEDLRISFTKPLNESLKNINDFFRELNYPIASSDVILRNKLANFRKEQEAQQLVAEAVAEDKGIEIAPLRRKVGGIVNKKVWVFKVVDEKKVPKKYWEINESKIREAIRLGVREIPGVEINQETQVSL